MRNCSCEDCWAKNRENPNDEVPSFGISVNVTYKRDVQLLRDTASNDAHVPLCASFDAAFTRWCDLGQWRQAMLWKIEKTPESPGSRSTAHPWLNTTPLRGYVPTFRRETGEANPFDFHVNSM